MDGLTWQDYEAELEPRLAALHDRIHRGAYRPQPARRTYIPKADGRQRPLAIAALEDKIVQGAVVMVLNAIFEEDFLGFSYGFRPGRGTHDALDALVVAIEHAEGEPHPGRRHPKFFDSVSQEWLVRFVEHRVGDKRIVRLIRKWLKAGILEDGTVTVSDRGTGQGSVISPLLANIYLHYVLDLWAERWRRHEATGDMVIVRYADDVVVGFEHEADAGRFLARCVRGSKSLRCRSIRTRPALHRVWPPCGGQPRQRGLGKPETFTFLGFTFICGKSRSGKFLLKRKSRGDRVQAKLAEIKEELRHRRHQPIPEQGRWLAQVVSGFFNYHAVPTNFRALQAFRDHVRDLWRRSLRRRSQRDRMTFERMKKLAHDWLPRPRILHPWPSDRFAVKHPRWEPYAGIPPVRICAGGAQ